MNEETAPAAPARKPQAFTLAGMEVILSILAGILSGNHALRGEQIYGLKYDGQELVEIQFSAASLVKVAGKWVQMDNGRPVAIHG